MKEFNVYEDEYWKDVIGYEKRYKISTFGRIMSLPKDRKVFKGFVSMPEKIMKPDQSSTGYPRVHLYKNRKSKRFSIHRLMEKNFPCNFIGQSGDQIDHIDRVRNNNHITNLRKSCQSNNNRNMPKKKGCKSKYKGVTFDGVKHVKKWRVKIECDGKRHNVGYFLTQEEAAKAYDNKARELFGEYGTYNFPKEGERSALLA